MTTRLTCQGSGSGSYLLAPRQVHQVELPRQLHLRLHVLLLDADEEDAVAARAVLVHVCRSTTGWQSAGLVAMETRATGANPGQDQEDAEPKPWGSEVTLEPEGSLSPVNGLRLALA